MNAIQEGCEAKLVKPRLDELTEQKESPQNQLDKLKMQAIRGLITPAVVKKEFDSSSEIMASCDHEEIKRVLVRHIDKVMVDDNKGKIKAYYHISDNKTVKKNVYHGGVGDGT